MVPSSSGLGYRPLTAKTRVRVPLGLPNNFKELAVTKAYFFFSGKLFRFFSRGKQFRRFQGILVRMLDMPVRKSEVLLPQHTLNPLADSL
jgi:hypothetical protein